MFCTHQKISLPISSKYNRIKEMTKKRCLGVLQSAEVLYYTEMWNAHIVLVCLFLASGGVEMISMIHIL